MKLHELPLPQVQVPFAHTAWQLRLLPSQVAWQGGMKPEQSIEKK